MPKFKTKQEVAKFRVGIKRELRKRGLRFGNGDTTESLVKLEEENE